MTKLVTIRCAVILALVFAGCAKQPTTTQLTSPAPGGAAGGGQAGTDGTRQGAGNLTDGSRGGAGSSGGAGTRPSPQDFRPAQELADVHFDFDKADIREADAKVLDANAGWLKAHPDHLVLIEGHCDERGTNEYNRPSATAGPRPR